MINNIQLVVLENKSWSSSNQSFLYSLYNIKGYQPVQLNLTGRDNNERAIAGYAKAGPIFGNDIVIYNNASSNFNSFSRLGRAYQTPPGCNSCHQFFVGSFNIKLSDVEVFYETTA